MTRTRILQRPAEVEHEKNMGFARSVHRADVSDRSEAAPAV